jgi:hypothetical protein
MTVICKNQEPLPDFRLVGVLVNFISVLIYRLPGLRVLSWL